MSNESQAEIHRNAERAQAQLRALRERNADLERMIDEICNIGENLKPCKNPDCVHSRAMLERILSRHTKAAAS